MEVFLSDLMKAQQEAGMAPAALVHGAPIPGDPSAILRVPVDAHLLFTPIALRYRRYLRRAIRTFRPDVLHLHLPNPSVFWALTLAEAGQRPWVVHWHSDVLTEAHSPAMKLAYQAYRGLEQEILARASQVVVTSPPYLEASAPLRTWREKCVVIPLGLPAKPAEPRGQSAEGMGWRPGAFRVLAIGRLTYYKNFTVLIEAVAQLENIELLIVGAGELQTRLEAEIRDRIPDGGSVSVRLLGGVDDDEKERLLASADLLCLPSKERTEAFGLVLLEAMRAETPCLVSDLPGSGMPWIVETSGCGRTVPLGDVSHWVEAIRRMQQEPERLKPLGHSGQNAWAERFEIGQVVRSLTHVYRRVVDEPCSAAQASASPDEVLIVIPAKDEVATVGGIIRDLRAAGHRHILVIDDHSVDGTGDAARAAGAIVIIPELPLGAWGAMQAGIRYGLRHGFQGVITMDADGQHRVEEIETLLGRRDSADVVIGAYPQRATPARRVAASWFKVLSGMALADLFSGFRFYNEAAMRVAITPAASLLDYQDIGVLLQMERAGLRIAEVAVSMNLRVSGRSRIFDSWWTVSRYMAATTLLCLSQKNHQKRFPVRPWPPVAGA
jgi:glycosyltransferase involved in cell wall biosynthesis